MSAAPQAAAARRAFIQRQRGVMRRSGCAYFCFLMTLLLSLTVAMRFAQLDVGMCIGLTAFPFGVMIAYRILRRYRCRTGRIASSDSTSAIAHSRTARANKNIDGTYFVLHAADGPLLITAVTFGGDLGEVQVFTSRDSIAGRGGLGCRWITGGTDSDRWRTRCWDATGGWQYDWRGWVAVGASQCEASWGGEDAQITLDMPVAIAANRSRAFYIRCTEDTEAPDYPGRLLLEGKPVMVAQDWLGAGAGISSCANRAGGEPCVILHAMSHDSEAHLLLGDLRRRQMKALCFSGLIEYEMCDAQDARFASAEAALVDKLPVLEHFMPGIGNVNRLLIDEWHRRAIAFESPLHLQLPQLVPPWVPLSPSDDAELDRLWGAHPAMRALWLQALGADAPIARLREAVCAARSCMAVNTATALLQQELEQLLQGDQELSPLSMSAAQRALEALKTASQNGASADLPTLQGVLSAELEQLNAMLLPRAAAWLSSDKAQLFERLKLVKPAAVSLSSFSLLRLYGKGAYAEVYAARKEDTRALFALKLCRRTRVATKRAEEHLQMERKSLGQATNASPFLCPLRYAFTSDTHIALVLPFYTGGTLMVQIEERAKPHGGLPFVEVRWVGAQMVLALEAMHCMGVLHRDVKPANVMLTSEGYAVLSDFGLSEAPGVTGKAGTRGYWAPEVVRKQPQHEAADWWSLGVLLAYAATGMHPFHKRWVRQGEKRDPPAPEQCIILPLAEQQIGSSVSPAVTASTQQRATPSLEPTQPSPANVADGFTEEGLNYNTLYQPIDRYEFASDPQLNALLHGLMERDASRRLGASSGGEELRAHKLFQAVEWELLLARRLPAPWRPDPNLVYAKDFIAPLSEEAKAAKAPQPPQMPQPAVAPPLTGSTLPPPGSAQQQLQKQTAAPPGDVGTALDGWDYVCDEAAFGEELAEYAVKLQTLKKKTKSHGGWEGLQWPI